MTSSSQEKLSSDIPGVESEALHPCPYCSGPSRFFVASTDRNRHTTDVVFSYYQCRDCGLVFMDPIPADLTPFYAGGYQTIPESLSDLRIIAERERYRMKPILKLKSGGKLLEIGPWMGIFSCNAKDAGFDVTAIEMDRYCADFLNRVVGVRAVQSSDPVQALDQLQEKFDVIALWHSLEHLTSPWRVIEKAAQSLAPGGILVVAIPNIGSYQYSVLKAAWKHLDAPRHLYFYPVASLTRLCQECGLSALETTTADELSRILSWDGWMSRAKLINPLRCIRGPIGLLFSAAARNAERKPNAGAGLTAIFQLSATTQVR